MSLKNSNTTADYIEWNTAVNLVHRLFKDGNYQMSLLIGCGIFFGLRISDILQLGIQEKYTIIGIKLICGLLKKF